MTYACLTLEELEKMYGKGYEEAIIGWCRKGAKYGYLVDLKVLERMKRRRGNVIRVTRLDVNVVDNL